MLYLSDANRLSGVEIIRFFHINRKKIFDYLDHQNSVITLSSQSGMATSNIFTKIISSQETLTSGSFSHSSNTSLSMPSDHRLVDTTKDQKIVLVTFGVSEGSFAIVVQEIKG